MKLFRKIENLFAASAFAEAGEFDTARSIAAEGVGEKRQRVRVTHVKSGKPASESSRTLGAGSKS